jgi:hypothetical protein
VGPALENLRVVALGAAPLHLEVRFRDDPKMRAIAVHLVSEPAELAGELKETLEGRAPPPSVEARLPEVVEVVRLELGFPMLENMGIVLASELASYLAQKGGGFFVDDDDQWFESHDGVIQSITG